MQKIYFEEEQSFRENPILIWIAPPLVAVITIPFLYGLYWQLIMGEPWGDKPTNDVSLLLVSLLVFLIVVFVLWMVLNTKLELKIDTKGIHYRCYPIVYKWKFIPKVDIAEYEIRKFGIFELGKKGFHKNVITKRERMTIRGTNALKLKTNTGKEVLIGTGKLTDLKEAMKKLMSNKES